LPSLDLFTHLLTKPQLKELLGDKPIVMDREFSYEELFHAFLVEGMKFVIRLSVGSGATVVDEYVEKVILSLRPGEKVFYKGVYYKGKVKVNLAGEWKNGRGMEEGIP